MKVSFHILWWPFLKANKLRVIGIITLGLVVSYFSLLLPLSIGKFFEISFGDGSNKAKALQLLGIRLPDGIFNFFNFFLLINVMKFATTWAYGFYSCLLGESFAASLRNRFFQYQLQQRQLEAYKIKASTLLPFGNDIKALQQFMVKGVLGLLKDILFLLMSLYLLFSIQPILTAIIIVMTGLFYILHRWFNLVHKPLYASKRRKQAGLINKVAAMLEQNRIPTEADMVVLHKKTTGLSQTLSRYHARKSLLSALTPFMLYLMLGIIMIINVIWASQISITPGETIVFILLLMALFPTIRNIIRIEHTWVQGELAAVKFIKTPENQMLREKEQIATNNSFSLLQSESNGN